MLIHTAEQLEATTNQKASLLASDKAHRRRELAKILWGDDLGDVTLSLRSEQFQVLGGLRLPRAAVPSRRSSGPLPSVAVLRQMGDAFGENTAVGGSLLWDAREREVAALKLALCTSPNPSQEYCLSFDHTGGLTGSVKAKRDGFTMRLFGTLDLNRKGASNAGAELVYDLD
ncbi:hypothetical protein AB1Y20_012366 [Prymnesium parvum]|uniref:Uncharacterized protein n=1 Tax=Prymnesium parvum TaxID=97485 RepID=A0AB34IR21_PRYPA